MTQYAFYFDGTRCSGCKTCVYACKDAYDLELGQALRRVYEYVGGETVKDEGGCFSTTCFSYPVSVACNHCERPSCVEACPTGAMSKSESTGLVSVDQNACIACGSCVSACPYGAPKVDAEAGFTRKCDGCAALVEKGEQPYCVASCPARALDFGPMDELVEKYPDAAVLDLAPLPGPDQTGPCMLVRACKDARPSGDTDGELANPVEVM
ncbi:MAG: 4Fe-4S binding protein [Coriobacteriia bacterium]|nr:4Fe-4S binding protein [Coriobacteriia bacterium]MBS5478958.1 4Fe-4S binding protein [Coriobacteriia bacterium]